MTKTELTTSFRVWTAVITVFAPGAGKRRIHTKLEVLNAGYKAERDKRLELSTYLGDLQEYAGEALSENKRLAAENEDLRTQLATALAAQGGHHPTWAEVPAAAPTAAPPTIKSGEESASERTHPRLYLSAFEGSAEVATLHARGARTTIPRQKSHPN